MDQAQQRELVDRYIAAYNACDVEGMMATLHPDITFLNVSAGRVNAKAAGAKEFRELAAQAVSVFSERTQTIEHFNVEEATAIAEISWEGVLAANFPPLGASGDRVRLRGRSEFVFRDGLIVRLTDES